jgi:hypothetical protein
MSGRIARILMLVSASTLCVGAFVPAGAAVSTVQRGASTLHAHKNLGTWGTATEVPGTGSFNIGGNDELDDVSCSSPGNCSGGGIYKDVAGNFQLFVVDEVGGIWGTAKEMPGSPFLNAGGDATFSQISCASAGNCAAVGGYRDISGMYQAFVVNEANSVWGVAIEVPGTPVLNAGGVAGSLSVTCPTAGNCTAGGFYSDTPTTVQAFGVSETNGNWGTAVVIPGSAALNAGGAAGLVTVKCATPGNCSADRFDPPAGLRRQPVRRRVGLGDGSPRHRDVERRRTGARHGSLLLVGWELQYRGLLHRRRLPPTGLRRQRGEWRMGYGDRSPRHRGAERRRQCGP